MPSEDSTGRRRRLGAIAKTSNGRARRAPIEGAWAYRHPAKVSEHIQRRLDALPKPIQDIGWKAQVRLCRRFRRLVARGLCAAEGIAFVLGHALAMKAIHGGKAKNDKIDSHKIAVLLRAGMLLTGGGLIGVRRRLRRHSGPPVDVLTL